MQRLTPEQRRSRAVRLNRRHQDMVREKIRASTIVRRIQAFVLDEELLQPDGHGGSKRMKVEFTDTQLRAAAMLLDKCLPDLARVDVTGGEDFGSKAAEFSALQTAAILRTALSQTDAALEYERLMLGTTEDAPLQLPAPENSQ